MDWYLQAWRKWNDFAGRARRTEFWMFILFNALVVWGLAALEVVFGSFGILSWLYSLVVIVPALAVTVRRLHDTGREGLWAAGMFVPLLNLVVLYFCILEGDPGANRYGASPKAA
jgi:uncharacterized membrane protein YhaH (DUF805 family)